MNPLIMLLALFGSALGMAGAGGKGGDVASGKMPTSSKPDKVTPGDTGTKGDPTGGGTQGNPTPTPPVTTSPDPTPPPPEGNPDNVVAPTQPGGAGSGSSGGQGNEVVVSEVASDVLSGRVTTLRPSGDDIASVRVLEGPAAGNVTVNPDQSLALVLTGTDYTGDLAFQYEITRTDGTVETVRADLNVLQGPVQGGWGLGDFYMLETDENGELIVEWGDNHRDVYVSGSDDALTLSDIAALEGLSVDKITGAWLAANPEYGASEGMALAEDAANSLWRTLAEASAKEPASHWLRLEAGYEYKISGILRAGITGESELHPIHITSYGEGEKPILTETVTAIKEGATNVVFSNIELGAGASFNPSSNILMENITSRGEEIAVMRSEGFTIRNSEIFDVVREESVRDGSWEASPNRISGIFSSETKGILIENTLWDHNSWVEGYDPGMSLDGPQPPSIYSHNIYMQSNTLDVTFRDSITMRAASFGAQFRGGAYIEDNVFLDNNAAVYVSGGKEIDGVKIGNYSLYADNVVTSAGFNVYGGPNGQLTGGMGDYAPLTTWVDNIVAHLANPDDPNELAEKTRSEDAVKGGTEAYYNDTIVYNWRGSNRDPGFQDANTDGLNANVLDLTTIQRFTAQLLDKPNASISDLADYLRASAQGAFDGVSDAEMIIEFFQAGFGLTPDVRLEEDTLRFVPNDLADGVRWDNRLNWSTQDLPGTFAGDSVDLAGNWVMYGGTTKIQDFDFGDGGRLTANHGRLDVRGDILAEGKGGQFVIAESGQIWINGYDGDALLDVDLNGGRFANKGAIDGRMDLRITNGQALLATDGARFDLENGSMIEIVGGTAKVGFEGVAGDTAVLRLEQGGILSFDAEGGKLGTISEFRSGANFDQAVNVSSGINLGEGTLRLDLSGLAAEAGDHTLISVDELIGAFSGIDVTGLSAARDARLVFDYGRDQVILRVGQEGAGTGQFNLSVLGDQMDAQANAELWAALTEGQPVLGDQMPDEVTLDDEVLADIP
ncbi:right-handed parallel beta-helix repeat-containing protein [Palleronia sp. KMU-117]|uniref:right-handed parallel beta-helix repeat-containing protein n=1 Tax=Palleronia sp. KMU-117 TaxID=3434108 RepID=UPI003D7550C2